MNEQEKGRFFAVLLRTRSLLKFINAYAVSNTTIACESAVCAQLFEC
jgi:hypothetical protein